MLTAANLDRQQREREIAGLSLPAMLLSTGAMSGPHFTPRPLTVGPLQRVRRAVRGWLINRKGITL